MYPRNAASPERISIGAVVLIADGTVQTSGVSIKVKPQGASASAGGGTTSYEEGVVGYLPTQAETDYTSIQIIAYKTGCIPASVTVVTSASAVPGHAGIDWSKINAPTTAQNLSGTNIDVDQVVASVTGAVGSVSGLTAATVHADLDDIQARLPAALVSGRMDASVGAMAANVMTAAAAASDLTTELQSGLATASALSTLQGNVTDILADTADMQPKLGTPAGVSLAADIAAIEAQTDDIGAAGAGLTALPWNAAWDAEVQSEVADALATYGAATATDVTTAAANVSVDEIQVSALADLFNTNSGTNYGAAVSGSAVKEIADNAGGSGLTTGAIADAVWDEVLSGHAGAGSAGEALAAAGGAGDPWITNLPGSYSAGQAGKIVGDYLNASVSSRATQTSVDDLPTNAELATALGPLPTAAENATAIWAAGTRTLTAIDEDSTTLDLDTTIRAAVGLGSANLDTQLGDLPTNAELATALGTADDAVLAAISALSIPTAGAIADAVCDEALSGHTTAGTVGKALIDTDLRGSRTVIRGTCAGSATTTTMTPSALSPSGVDADQFKGRILIFDNDTTTTALRGQATDITANSAAGLPLLTFTALTTAPASGDTFSIV